MSKNYDIIHFIQNRMGNMDNKVTSAVTRMFNKLESRNCYASALSTSITLYLAFKCLEFNPKLILGTIQYQGLSYPHAWLELDDKVFDLATYEDIQHHPVLKERGLKLINPQINIGYEEASQEICYYPFQFGDMWQLNNMQRLVGKTFEEYAKGAPYFDIYGDVCYILEISETPESLDLLGAMAKATYIKDRV